MILSGKLLVNNSNFLILVFRTMRSLYAGFLFLYFITGIIAENECIKTSDCSLESSICVNETCICAPDFVFNSERTKCLKVSHGYGAPCSDSIQCSATLESGGLCNNSICICAQGYHYFRGQCWKTSGLTEKCVHDSNCFVSYDFEASVCNNLTKVCECSPGYYQREYSSCRKSSYKPGEPCGIALDCKYPNATCTKDRTCGNSSEYIDPKEDQGQILYDVDDICRKKRTILTFFANLGSNKIGEPCTNDMDCPKNAECHERCYCQRGFYTTDNSTCYPELGSRCNNDKDCIGKNTMCRNSTYCTCKQGFVTTQDSRQCNKMSRNIGWSCLRDEECGFFGPGGKCISKKCHCSNDTHWVLDQFYCWVSKKVGEICEQSEDCGGKNSSMTCKDKKCACIPDTHPSSTNRTCNKDSKQVGLPCNENLDCIYDHAECNTTSHACSCQRGYLENDTICTAGINGTCKTSDDCLVKNSHCNNNNNNNNNNNTCECDNDFVSSKSLATCLPLAKNIGVNCSESQQCSVLSADCIQGVCNCQNGSYFVQKENKCYLKSIINQNCTRQQNCFVSHSECLKNVCKCKRGYVPHANFTMCVNGARAEVPFNLMLITCTILALLGLIFNSY